MHFNILSILFELTSTVVMFGSIMR